MSGPAGDVRSAWCAPALDGLRMTAGADADTALLQEAGRTAQRMARRAAVRIEPLTTMDRMNCASRLFDRVWGIGPGDASEIQPALLRALQHSGSYLTGAYRGEEMVAASVAFLAAPIGRGLHSHITGVLPGLIGGGVGSALKWHQRAWSLDRGIDTVSWTYDPLIARNSFFNMARLGAGPREYLVDFYGPMADELNAGQPSDRVLAVWDLRSDAVAHCASGVFSTIAVTDLVAAGAGVVLTADDDGRPRTHESSSDVRLLELPPDVETLRRLDPGTALQWRLALRETLAPLMQDSAWRVTDFLPTGRYVLRRNASQETT